LAILLQFVFRVLQSRTNYSHTNAVRMCELSLAAYCCGNLGHGCENWSCNSCKTQQGIVNVTQVHTTELNNNVNGYVAYDIQLSAIIVSFAGTDPLSLSDWMDDLNFLKEKYSACDNCEVDTGFYQSYKAIRNQVWDAVEKYWNLYNKEKTTLQITGWGFGGALATFCALDFWDQGQVEPEYVITFGQPRVGNQAFSEYFNSKINNNFRVTHKRDPIPHLPLLDMDYYHTAREIFYPHGANSSWDYKVCDDTGEDPSCSDKYLLDLAIWDHFDYMGYALIDNWLACKA